MSTTRKSNDGAIDRTIPDWYKDAVIYQLHVKAFQDSNDDGMGDFPGLMRRLDYIQELGVNTIWILPFYPSPLRDDGYDIADYKSVNPSYGQMKDFKAFVTEAHKRGLRVVTELVINHTSDQHPWFQKARHAKPGSAARDMYVWSDTDTKWPETRIIFTDTEKSNWTWDPVAGAFFWHRFYSHQPDLNFDNPRVMREVLKVMHYWLDMGVDGLRLDAIPYLVERDGTNNENLPETHDVLKEIRANLDERFSDRMLLAEANQWPEDTRPYFGEGDECHMGFHFPLMPRMYMAVAQEDRHPITDIIRQTPDIPENCQWAIFLRNHDELTLEMVTDKERDYLWRTYAEDPRARINLGIRRRLAPLMQNDRRKIELLNSLLMSMPGTPIVYYGDEIGMGDNYYLGDRDGVRTPMQWTSDRNAGFSRADPQRLYLPAILDPIYGYPAINVESQSRDPSSLLNWMRRLIKVRKQHPAFGRGEMTLLYPHNRKILAYVREHEEGAILCVANLSRAAQAVELDLGRWKGCVPVELLGQSPFPPVGDLPYLFTMPGYGFYWFVLADETEAPKWHQSVPDVLPEFMTLTAVDGKLSNALAGRDGKEFQRDALAKFLPLQRWFAAKDRRIGKVSIEQFGALDNDRVLAECTVDVGGEKQRYFLPLAVRWGEENLAFGAPKLSYTIAKLRRGPRVAALIDGAMDEKLAATLLDKLRKDDRLETDGSAIVFKGNEYLAEYDTDEEPRAMGVEQSNLSLAFGDSLMLKIYRRVRSGTQPDVEMSRFLTETAKYENTPAYLGSITHEPKKGENTTLAAAFAYVANQGNAWDVLSAGLGRDLQDFELSPILPAAGEEVEESEGFAFPLNVGSILGQRTAEMHAALATPTDEEAFKTEPITKDHIAEWVGEARQDVETMLDGLKNAVSSLDGTEKEQAETLLGNRKALLARLEAASKMKPVGSCSRIHGDYHLGQVLVVQDDLMVIDFEGEPRRPLEERRRKSSPLRDVAGMLRSLDYLAATAREKIGTLAEGVRETAAERVDLWHEATERDFHAAYREHIASSPTWPDDEAFAQSLLDLFLIQKSAYEISYELANRPKWVKIPLGGLLKLLDLEKPQ